jgi:hypothetical protein
MTRVRLLERARQAMATAAASRWSWVAAFVLVSPALATGYVLDDLQQHSMVIGTYDEVQRGAGELYCFSPGPGRGIDPAILSWWDDARSSLCFLRPLSSWTLWLDHTFTWSWPALPHLHSLLWFMGLWLAWRAILLRYLPADIANTSLLLTAASSAVAMTTAWIAARHALVGGCLGVWGAYHVLASRDPVNGQRAGLSLRELLGYTLIGLGLFASEMVLGVIGLLVAREFWTRSAQGGRLPGALSRIAAYGVCSLAYVGSHARLGYGAPKYALYLNPTGDPVTFLRALPERLLGLSADLVLGVPSDAWVYPELVPLLSALAVCSLLVLLVGVLRLLRDRGLPERPSLVWLGWGGLLSLAPSLSGMQGGRALTIAAFPLFALIAACLLRSPRTAAEPALSRRLGKLALVILFAGAFIGNPAAHAAWYSMIDELDRAGEKSFDGKQTSCPPQSDVYLVDASESGAVAWYARYWLKDVLQAKNYRQLTMSPIGAHSIAVHRTGPSSLTLRSSGGPLVGQMAVPPGSEGLFRPGLERRYDDYRVRVTHVSERGPTEIELEFAQPIDAPGMCIFVQDDVRLYQLERLPVGSAHVLHPMSPLQSLSTWLERVGGQGAISSGAARAAASQEGE